MMLKGFILGIECWPSLLMKSTVAFRTTEHCVHCYLYTCSDDAQRSSWFINCYIL